MGALCFVFIHFILIYCVFLINKLGLSKLSRLFIGSKCVHMLSMQVFKNNGNKIMDAKKMNKKDVQLIVINRNWIANAI